MKKLFLVVFFFAILFLITLSQKNSSMDSVVIDGKEFKAEITKTQSQKEIGLAKYDKIDDNFAMVFPFENEDYYAFWMKGMKFSIDIIYVSKGKVVDLFKNVSFKDEFKIYRPKSLSDTIIEINAGLSTKYNFKEGNIVSYK